MDPFVLKKILIPLVLFGGIAFVWWTMLEAIVRYRMLKEGVSDALLASMMSGEAQRRRRAALRWGLVLAAVGAVMVLVQAVGWRIDSAGGVGLLMLAAGAAQLLFYRLTQRDG